MQIDGFSLYLHCQFFVLCFFFLCVSALESPVLKWLCFMWCGAATLVLLALPKLIIDNSTTLDTQVGRLCAVYCMYLCVCVQVLDLSIHISNLGCFLP